MGGKTGTTNSNADFWFMGYTPQLQAGAWVGCDDRFITLESSAFFGGSVARPIWEAFFKKVYADRTLGIDKDARFVRPADMNNVPGYNGEVLIDQLPGSEEGNGPQPSDYYEFNPAENYIQPESKPFIEDNKPAKRDSVKNDDLKKNNSDKPIGSGKEEETKKKGFLRKLFNNKKDKN
jgi:penicillin-binding protein 1A